MESRFVSLRFAGNLEDFRERLEESEMKKIAVVLALAFVMASAGQAAPVAGDVIKLDLGSVGDGEGGSLADWNQFNAPGQAIDEAPGQLAAGQHHVRRAGDVADARMSKIDEALGGKLAGALMLSQ